MGGLSTPLTLSVGSAAGQVPEASTAQTNLCTDGANIGASWTAEGAPVVVKANQFDNGFLPSDITTPNGATSRLKSAPIPLYTTTHIPALATDRINCFSIYCLASGGANPSPQCRFEATLTPSGTVLSLDVNPITGVLIAKAGNPATVAVDRILVPLLAAVENVTLYRISFSLDVGTDTLAVLRAYPRTDGAAVGSVIFGGAMVEGQVSYPTPFISFGSSNVGNAPRQTYVPNLRHRLLSAGFTPYTVDPSADQDTWLECDILAGNTINLPVVSTVVNDPPVGSRLLVTQSANAVGGITTITGAANSIIAPGGITAAYTSVTFPSTDFPNVTQMMLIKTATQNQWEIIATSAGGSGSGLFTQLGTGAVTMTFEQKGQDHVNLLDFIPLTLRAAIINGTSTVDVSAYIQAALDSRGDNLTVYGGGFYYYLTSGISIHGTAAGGGNKVLDMEGGTLHFVNAGSIDCVTVTVNGAFSAGHEEYGNGIQNAIIDATNVGGVTANGLKMIGKAHLHKNRNVTIIGLGHGVVAAGAFVVGRCYQIKTVGTTNFTLIGAQSNTVGLPFVATGVGTGTGDAYGGGIGYLVQGGSVAGAFNSPDKGLADNITCRNCFDAFVWDGTTLDAALMSGHQLSHLYAPTTFNVAYRINACAEFSGSGLNGEGGGALPLYIDDNHVSGVTTGGGGHVLAGGLIEGYSLSPLYFNPNPANGNIILFKGSAPTSTTANLFAAPGNVLGNGGGIVVREQYAPIADVNSATPFLITAADALQQELTVMSRRGQFAKLLLSVGGRSTVALAVVNAGAFVTEVVYTILVPGTTNFTLIGAANNNVGTVFTATGPGAGTGTAMSGFVEIIWQSAVIDLNFSTIKGTANHCNIYVGNEGGVPGYYMENLAALGGGSGLTTAGFHLLKIT